MEKGYKYSNQGGKVGRLMRQLWIKKYNLPKDAQPPKRDTSYHGKPYKENVYYGKDTDIMEEALAKYCERQSQA